MDWKECKNRNVKEIKPNKERAKSLRNTAERRLEFIRKSKDKGGAEFVTENYYETAKELITSLMFIKGFKSYSHLCLIVFLEEFYQGFQESELELVDQLRRTRNDVMYRGKSVAADYLDRRESEIMEIIEKLMKLVEKELEK